jgi:hypothetical protein
MTHDTSTSDKTHLSEVTIAGRIALADDDFRFEIESARAAYATIEAYGWQVHHRGPGPVPDDGWPIDIIAKAIHDVVDDRKKLIGALSVAVLGLDLMANSVHSGDTARNHAKAVLDHLRRKYNVTPDNT